MKRTILGLAMCVMFTASTALVALGQPATAPAGGDGARRGLGGPGGGGGGQGRGRGGPVVIGPAAPVPPQVAMLRPTTQEVTQLNDAIKKMVDADNSPSKALLKKYESLLMVQQPRFNTAAAFTQGGPRVGGRHDAFVEIAKKGDIDLLFNGDSITDGWDNNDANKAMIEKHFGGIKLANFGVGGDTTQGILWGLQNGEGQGFSPKAIMLMIGTNNMAGNTPGEIAEGIGAIVLEMRKHFPNAKILMLAIFPRGTPGDPIRERIVECNKIISKLDDQKNVFYLDIGAKFLAADGTLDETMPDRLHPNAKGYDIWGEAVKGKLAELMK